MIWLIVLLLISICGVVIFMNGIEDTIKRRNIDRLRLRQFIFLYGTSCVIGGAAAVMILLKMVGEI